MPNLGLSEEDVTEVLEYLKAEDRKVLDSDASVPASENP